LRFLLDSCVSGQLKQVLTAEGHDVEWCGDWQKDPGDGAVLAYAHEQQRVLLTLDKDFGELAIVKGAPHAGILRLSGLRLSEHASATLAVIDRHGEELDQGALITVTPGRMRIRNAR
jgi:predicted nuclease of predicted toxin-antitoxin system